MPRIKILAFAALSSLVTGTTAHAQIKPKIMIIFDTSGSMLASSSDGSPLCNGVGQTSRIYQLKVALFDALQGVGASEVDFALATFPMFVDPMRTPKCSSSCSDPPAPNLCSGHYYVTNAQDSESNSGNNACKVSTHTNPNSASQQNATCSVAANCPWYAGYKNEVLKVPFGRPPEEILLYFDQQEDAGPVAVLTNPEVRARGNWYTPLGKSLFYAHGYFDKEVALPASDYRKKCERLVVAFFTDGEETCDTSTSDAFYPTKWATALNQNLGVVVNTVAIDINQGSIQAIANAGGGQYFNVSGNANALKTAFLSIIANSLPPSETCNNQDDDCDNLVDEDFPLKGKPCTNGLLGACARTGVYVCKPDGSGVQCNAPTATGTAEICDGIDNNCNGQIDEGLTNCTPCAPQPEICDGKDNNCNGQIDDGVPTGVCGSNIGECKQGTLKCVNGMSTCDGAVGPQAETCNNKDDDCDGQVDGLLRACYPFATGCDPVAGTCQGQCRLGQETCTAGVWGNCQGAVGPSAEVCDGLDNNCDGQIDEKAECPGGSQCVQGQCTEPCNTGEFVCKAGQICKDGWCILDKCDRAECHAKGWICEAGECVDPCKGVSCKTFEKCVQGLCVDQSCYNPKNACPSGKRCIDGQCADDPCAGVSCGVAEFCSNGSCVKLCDGVQCPLGQSCQVVDEGGTLQTKCADDACAGSYCGNGTVCKNGNCINDPCLAVSCPGGQVCVDGQCIKDPCQTVTCPFGYACKLGNCSPTSDATTTDLLATGAGGCACKLDAGDALASPPLSMLLLLGLALLLRRRRRTRRM
ncbi:MAG: hypothetical protein KC503_26000 [Myxococcales bacterium]|nr:hypothetical protein [Myxococcales bacterium]